MPKNVTGDGYAENVTGDDFPGVGYAENVTGDDSADVSCFLFPYSVLTGFC